jgi:catechol 2,3-dioxygenase-like lactoylglutathione lyase family enzyme
MIPIRTKYKVYALLVAWAIAGALMIKIARSEAGKPEFAKTTIDIGMVVSDVDKAAKFYTQALGFTETGSFDVSGQMAADTGLTDNHPFKVRMFHLGKEPTATTLKIMQIPEAGPKKVDNQYIGSSLGFRYLTVLVADLNKTLDRLKQSQVAPVRPPYRLGTANSYLILVKDPDGNIIELIGPMP